MTLGLSEFLNSESLRSALVALPGDARLTGRRLQLLPEWTRQEGSGEQRDRVASIPGAVSQQLARNCQAAR